MMMHPILRFVYVHILIVKVVLLPPIVRSLPIVVGPLIVVVEVDEPIPIVPVTVVKIL